LNNTTREVPHFLSLNQGERLKQLVHRPKASRKDDASLRVFDEHRLSDKEVPKIDFEIDEWIGLLFEGQFNVAAELVSDS
jgi:hypothetical protein